MDERLHAIHRRLQDLAIPSLQRPALVVAYRPERWALCFGVQSGAPIAQLSVGPRLSGSIERADRDQLMRDLVRIDDAMDGGLLPLMTRGDDHDRFGFGAGALRTALAERSKGEGAWAQELSSTSSSSS